MLYDKMLTEYQRLEQQILSIQSAIADLPDGKLVCTRNSNRFKWYISDGHSLNYLPKSQRQHAEQLAQKKYLSSLLKDLIHEKRALELYIQHHNKNTTHTEQFFHTNSGYSELLTPYFKPTSEELFIWMKEPCNKNPKYPEQLTHKSVSGNLVRSKSEVLIDTLLYINHIPYRYESALQLGELTLYPDFTIRHPQTGQFYYWEHFGLMDDLSYSKNACSKLQCYSSHGIIPSIHLITTYETKEHPLNSDTIEKIIYDYFL